MKETFKKRSGRTLLQAMPARLLRCKIGQWIREGRPIIVTIETVE